jgi:hypothetical protein
MGKRIEPKVLSYSDFSTGLDEYGSKYADRNPLDPNYGMRAQAVLKNVFVSKNGAEKAPGWVDMLAEAADGIVTGECDYTVESQGISEHIVTIGTKLYKRNDDTLEELYSGLADGVRCRFLITNDVLLVMNGIDPVVYYDGSTAAAVTFNDPDNIWQDFRPSFAVIFRNRVHYGGDPSYPDDVATPVPGTYNDFDNTNGEVDRYQVSPGDGGVLVMMRPLTKDALVFYKTNGIHRLRGSTPFGSDVDPFVLEEVRRGIGCIAGDTVVEAIGDHWFLAPSGFKSLSTVQQYGDVQEKNPSARIPESVGNLNLQTSAIRGAFAVYIETKRQVWLHVPTGDSSTNDMVYCFSVDTGGIMPREGIPASCGAIVGNVYYTGTYDGRVQQQFTGLDYGDAAIESEFEIKWQGSGNISQTLRFAFLNIDFETAGESSIVVQWQILKARGTIQTRSKTVSSNSDDQFDTGNWDEAVFDAGASSTFHKKRLGRGVAIKVRIINNNAGETWRATKIDLGIIPLGKIAA